MKVGKKAMPEYRPMLPGELEIIFTDLHKARTANWHDPTFGLDSGIELFVSWYIQIKKMLIPEMNLHRQDNKVSYTIQKIQPLVLMIWRIS